MYTKSERNLKELQAILLEEVSKEQRSAKQAKRKNVSPKIWGPPAWLFLDKVVEGYPVKAGRVDKVKMLDFLTSLGYVLPCERCRYNYETFKRTKPIINSLNGRASVKRWLTSYKLHQERNK